MNRSNLLTALVSSALTASLVVAGPAAAREVGARLGISAATSTTTVPVQVRLASSSGVPINGLKTMTFKLYTVASGGSALWSETWTAGNAVQVTDGIATVLLGSQTALPQSLVANNSTLYLGITVDVEAEMLPRVQLGSAPIAMTVPDGAISTDKIVDGAITASKLGVPLPRLLGSKTCLGCGNTTEAGPGPDGWLSVKGINNDPIEITVTTSGRPVIVYMTARFFPIGATAKVWCGIVVKQNASQVQLVHMDGRDGNIADFGCSGSFVFLDLAPGTYTFVARGYALSATQVTWTEQRQIAVVEL